MQLMKKIISIILIAIVFCIGLSSCKNNCSKEAIEKESSDSNLFDRIDNNSNDINDSQDSDPYISEWIEIYSITYTIVGSVTYKSRYQWTFSEKEEINKEEYDTIDSKWKEASSSFFSTYTYVDMTAGKEAVNGNGFEKDEYYYFSKSTLNNDSSTENKYYKVLCTGLKPIYILIRFCTNGDIELQLENGLFRIRPTAYVIQYFDDIDALSK